MDNRPVWIFGYGSLIWRTGFPYRRSVPAAIEGYQRRFWQGSTDHRGIPGAPGRVVTLVKAPGVLCWGRAFEVELQDRSRVLDELDHREKGGYQRLSLKCQLNQGQYVSGLTWIATPENENYLGPASARAIANQVLRSSGPSGSNREYVLRLEEALMADAREDTHVSSVAQWIRRIEGSQCAVE